MAPVCKSNMEFARRFSVGLVCPSDINPRREKVTGENGKVPETGSGRTGETRSIRDARSPPFVFPVGDETTDHPTPPQASVSLAAAVPTVSKATP